MIHVYGTALPLILSTLAHDVDYQDMRRQLGSVACLLVNA